MTFEGFTLKHKYLAEFLRKFAPQIIFLTIIAFFLFSRGLDLESKFGFDHDQEKAAESAWQIVYEKRPSLIGIETSTGGLFAGPFLNWTHATFLYLANFDPIALAYQAILSSTLTLILLFIFVREIAGTYQALLAAGIYASSARLYSFDISGSPLSYITLFTMAVIFLIYKIIYSKRNYMLPILAFLLALGSHVHLTLLILTPITLTILFLHKAKFSLKTIAISLIAFFMPLITFILFELRHSFLMIKNLSVMLVGDLYADHSPASETIETFISFLSQSVLIFNNISVPILLFIILLSIRTVFKKYKSITVDLLILIIGPLILMLFYSEHIPEYYFLAAVIPFIIFSSYILKEFYYCHRRLFVSLALAVFFVNTVTLTAISTNTLSLKVKKDIVDFVKNDSAGQPFKLQYDIPSGLGYGFNYLFKWKQVKPDQNSQLLYVIKHNSRGPAEASFGSFGVDSIK